MNADPQDTDTRIPVAVVTGYLGAGKTSLVNSILKGQPNQRFAIIVNEFGEIGIDGELVESGDEELIELSSGCICCVVRGDLIRTLRRLVTEKPDLDGIIIETTGLANPSPIIQTFLVDQIIGAQCRLDSVIAVVDAAHILHQLVANRDAADQIAFSDHIVLNKVDAATTSLDVIERRIRTFNPIAQITRTNRAAVSPDLILNRHSFNFDRIEAHFPPLEPDDDHTHGHIEANGITSVSLVENAPMDGDRLEEWLNDLLARKGNDILRTKGVLWIAGDDKKFVMQSVNMMVDGEFSNAWGKTAPISRLVLIGRNLNATALKTGFSGCRAQITE